MTEALHGSLAYAYCVLKTVVLKTRRHSLHSEILKLVKNPNAEKHNKHFFKHQNCPIILFKRSKFQHKISRYTNKKESVAHTQEK